MSTPPRPRARRVPARGAALALAILSIVAGSGGDLRADQRSSELPPLFEALVEVTDPNEAARIEGRIWQEWFVAPDEASRILLSRMSVATRSGELDLALELADRLVEEAPEFAEGWNRRATLHYLRGDDDLSVLDIRETLALEPRHFGAISGLGLIFLRRGDLEAALDAFEQVLRISPASRSAQQSADRIRRELEREI